jgi:hypothetical protein
MTDVGWFQGHRLLTVYGTLVMDWDGLEVMRSVYRCTYCLRTFIENDSVPTTDICVGRDKERAVVSREVLPIQWL